MKTFITKSWKTTLCGVGIATGLGLMGAPLIGWVNCDHRHAFMVCGWFICVGSALLLGIACRDHNVTSEQAGANSPPPIS